MLWRLCLLSFRYGSGKVQNLGKKLPTQQQILSLAKSFLGPLSMVWSRETSETTRHKDKRRFGRGAKQPPRSRRRWCPSQMSPLSVSLHSLGLQTPWLLNELLAVNPLISWTIQVWTGSRDSEPSQPVDTSPLPLAKFTGAIGPVKQVIAKDQTLFPWASQELTRESTGVKLTESHPISPSAYISQPEINTISCASDL